MIIACPKCGSENRIPDVSEPSKRYRCGRCGSRLADTRKASDSQDERSPTPQPAIMKEKKTIRVVGIALRKLPAVHPLLFAMLPILALYAYNVAEVSPSEIVLSTAIVLGSTVVLLLLSWLILKNVRKAGIILSIFLVLFFCYGLVLGAIGGRGAYGGLLPTRWVILSIVWVILFICGAYFVIKTRRTLDVLTTILNIVAAIVVIIPTINIAVHEIRAASHDIKTAESMETNAVDLGDVDTLPDIYYIVLDRYASASTLKEVFDFDNSEFIDYLSDRGFYVASESTSNYVKSRSSLASALNMDYINYLSEELGEGFTDLGPMYAMLQDYEVWRFLRSKGYEFIHFGSWWGPTAHNDYADKNFNYWQIPYFPMALFQMTMAYPFCIELGIVDDLYTMHRECALYSFDNLADIPNIKGPTFVVAHVFLPHAPYVFDRNGNYLTAEEANERSREVNYVDQLIFTNNKLRVLIDELLLSSEVPPIIILQADEGPFPEGTDSRDFKWEEATEAQLREKMGILNAYYLPDADENVLYPSITPVNSFRLVFNLYLDADFELLPDKIYAFYGGHPYKFLDVTEKVKYDKQ